MARSDPFDFETARIRALDFLAMKRTGARASERCSFLWEMTGDGSAETRFRVWQQFRAAGMFPPHAVAFLIIMTAEEIVELRAKKDPEAITLEVERGLMELASGYDADALGHWIEHEAPPEYEENCAAMTRVEARIEAQVLRDFGETMFAEMCETRHGDYENLREYGRRFFLGY